MNKNYQKPAMKPVELRSNKAVADQCWAYATGDKGGDGNAYYYELPNSEWGGKNTWIGFSVKPRVKANCKDFGSVEMHIYQYGDGIPEDRKQEAAQIAETAFADSLGPSGGSNYDGTSFSTTIGQSW